MAWSSAGEGKPACTVAGSDCTHRGGGDIEGKGGIHGDSLSAVIMLIGCTYIQYRN